MHLTTDQIVKITAEAPDGVNHIGNVDGQLVPMPNRAGTVHNIDDLREIAELRQKCDELAENNESLMRLLLEKARVHVALNEANIRAEAIGSLKAPFELPTTWTPQGFNTWVRGEAEKARNGVK